MLVLLASITLRIKIELSSSLSFTLELIQFRCVQIQVDKILLKII